MARMYIVRGAPGSGKSTFVKTFLIPMLIEEGIPADRIGHYENDMFHYDEDGNYNFDFSRHPAACAWCQRTAGDAMRNGEKDVVIVSNTGTVYGHEVKPYVDIAKSCNAPYEIIHMTTQFTNVHRCPESVVKSMLARYEHVDGEVTAEAFKEAHSK